MILPPRLRIRGTTRATIKLRARASSEPGLAIRPGLAIGPGLEARLEAGREVVYSQG